jgi:hypothetical protein
VFARADAVAVVVDVSARLPDPLRQVVFLSAS